MTFIKQLPQRADLCVIGGGSAGVRAARVAAEHGASVLLAEESRMGGTCVVRGCIPKKLYVYASRFWDEFEGCAGYGWDFPILPQFHWNDLVAAKEKEISRLSRLYEETLLNAGVQITHQRAQLESPHEVRLADGSLVRAETI